MMLKKTISLVIALNLLCILVLCHSEEAREKEDLYLAPASVESLGGCVGMIDETGKEIVPCKYSYLDGTGWGGTDPARMIGKIALKGDRYGSSVGYPRPPYEEFHTYMTSDGKVGVITTKGVDVPLDAKLISAFNEGIATVKTETGFTFVNTEGKFLAEPIYTQVWPICNGVGTLNLGSQMNYINTSGKRVSFKEFGRIYRTNDGIHAVMKDKKFRYTDLEFNDLTEPIYDDAFEFVGDHAFVRKGADFFIINRKFEETGPLPGSPQGKFCDGILRVKVDKLIGAVNCMGEVVVPFEYRLVSEPKFGMMDVYYGKFHGVIRTDGTILEKAIFDDVLIFESGYFFRVDNLWGFSNSNGIITREPCFSGFKEELIGRETFVAAEEDGIWRLYDIEGQKVLREIPWIKHGYYFLGSFSDGLYIFEQEGKRTVMREDGTTWETDFQRLSSFCNGFAKISQDGRVGVVNRDGQVIIEPQYRYISDFHNGRAYVTRGDVIGYVNNKGVFIIPPSFNAAGEFSEGLAAVAYGNKYGYIDTSGKLVVECRYDDAMPFVNGRAFVKCGWSWGIIDRKGEWVRKANMATEVQDFNCDIPMAGEIIHTPTGSSNRFCRMVIVTKDMKLIETSVPATFLQPENIRAALGDETWYKIQTCFFPQMRLSARNPRSERKPEEYAFQVLINEEDRMLTPPVFAEHGDGGDGLITARFSPEIFQFEDFTDADWTKNDRCKMMEHGYFTRETCMGFIKQLRELTFKAGFCFDIGTNAMNIPLYTVFLNHDGRIALPFVFEDAGDFSEGLAAVKVNGKWGYVDKSGKFVIEPVLEGVRKVPGQFYNGIALVVGDNYYRFINKSGKPVSFRLPGPDGKTFKDVESFELGTTEFANGLATLVSGMHYLVNDEHEVVLFTNYGAKKIAENLFGYYDYGNHKSFRYARVYTYEGGLKLLCGLMDKSGKRITEPLQTDIEYIGGNVLRVRNHVVYGLISMTGDELIEPFCLRIDHIASGGFVIQREDGFLLTDDNGKVIENKSFRFIGNFNNAGSTYEPPRPGYGKIGYEW